MAGDTARAATTDEVKDLRRESSTLKEVVAEQALELPLLKNRHDRGWGTRQKRYPAREKVEIIRIVAQSSLSARRPLEQTGVPRATFHRWYDQYQSGSPEAREDRPARPSRVSNRIPDDVFAAIIKLALEQSELSPRELAERFTDSQVFFVSEATVYRLLKVHDPIASPAFIVMKAASEFIGKPTIPNEMWQIDFTYFNVIGWARCICRQSSMIDRATTSPGGCARP